MTAKFIGRVLVSIFVISLTLFWSSQSIKAVDLPSNLGFSTIFLVKDPDATGGDIVSIPDPKNPSEKSELFLTSVPYDVNMFGVIVDNPNIVLKTPGATGSAILRDGQAFINVTTLGGAITVGDFVTSSPLKGKGQRANDFTAGYMVGVALSSYDGTGGTPVTIEGKQYQMGKVQVAVGIGPASPVKVKAGGGVLGTFRQFITAVLYNIRTSKTAERIVRIILAALVAIITIYINFRTFGKNITKGIESIGRNPLAKVSIQSMIILNTVMIGVVSLAGIALALVILSL